MKNSTLLLQILWAFVLTCLTSLVNELSLYFASPAMSASIALTVSLMLYQLLGIYSARLASGRLILLCLNLSLFLLAFLTISKLNHLILFYLLLIGLTRLLLRRPGLFAAFTDLGLCLLTAGLMIWQLGLGHSIISIIWCALLLQSLQILIPGKGFVNNDYDVKFDQDQFEQSLQIAENALQQLLQKN